MGMLDWLTGGGKTVEKVVDGIYEGGDALFYTEEEKARASQKVLDWKLEWLKATSPSRVARRIIAVTITAMWALLIAVAAIAKFFGQTEFATYLFDVMRDNVATPFSIVLGFYFAAHLPIGRGKGA